MIICIRDVHMICIIIQLGFNVDSYQFRNPVLNFACRGIAAWKTSLHISMVRTRMKQLSFSDSFRSGNRLLLSGQSCTIILIHPTIVATDLTLLVTMLKSKKLHNPLNFIHISILISQVGSRLTFLIGYLAYMPPAWWDCSCSIFLSSLMLSLYMFLSAYEPIAFAFLSCLQLL